MHVCQILAFILFTVAAVCAALSRRHGELLAISIALIGAGLAVELAPVVFSLGK